MLHQGPGGEAEENGGDDGRSDDGVDWPVCENVLRSLCEEVRPIRAAAVAEDEVQDDERAAVVAADVHSCLAERVVPLWAQDAAESANDEPLRVRPRWWPRTPEDGAVVAAAGRTQTRLMAVRSAYADGNYYASTVPYASRTVEELSLWPSVGRPRTADLNRNTYTVGTVLYDDGGGSTTCHLHGLEDPRRRVALDFARLSDRLPRHRSTVKMFSELRAQPTADGGAAGAPPPPVLVPHHFHVLARAAPFR